MVCYLLVKMTNKMVNYFVNKKDHPDHNGHVEINLSKMIRWIFWHLSKWGFFSLDYIIKPYFPLFMTCKFDELNPIIQACVTHVDGPST
jgi:hypothetical protein